MKRISTFFAATSILLFTASLVGCEKEANGTNDSFEPMLEVKSDGTSLLLSANLNSIITTATPGTVSEQEMLAFMKEEEKFARDVYSALESKWGTPIFANITKAEETHVNAVVTLMTKLGFTNTALLPAGEFENPTLATLYAQLIADGSKSLADAYKVGALIEEKDIFDLKEDLTKTTNTSIILVFENLIRASSNHLRAFDKQLTLLGQTYTPTYLNAATYTQIATSPMEQGKRYQLKYGNRN